MIHYYAYPGMPSMWRTKKITEASIMATLIRRYNLEVDDLQRQVRRVDIVECRHLCFYLIKKHVVTSTLTSIGRLFERDHTSVMHGIKSVKNRMHTELLFKEHVEELEEAIQYLP